MAIGALPAGLRMLRGDHASIAWIGEGVGDQERVATELLDLIVRQVGGVSNVHYSGDERDIGLLGEEDGGPHLRFPGPDAEFVRPVLEFPVALQRDLDLPEFAVMKEPIPELGNTRENRVVPISIDEDVGVEQIEHWDYPVAVAGAEA
jgi:hypothetical protein